ncbi:uncharacterized protein LOC122050527 [Zingiber officinale]|uniref:uncharacterized protein LOC122050527 n=1 Tax=Zingiber officinale TaxID=94328 RepID=UPI001C4BB68D|nr:uncharacterized protein LOC122050527 [Zingiber officinale]
MTRSALVSEGFNSWKRVNDGGKCAFLIHVGSLSSSHNRCVKCIQDLMKPKQNIDKVMNAQSMEEIIKNMLHLKATIEVKTMIRDESGDAKFCILVDEAQDESKKEQMSFILRFVNNSDFLVERFLEILGVEDTTLANLKKSISDIFVQHNIQIHNMRGQGYDGGANFQVMELNYRFSEATIELLALCSALDPSDSFKKFNVGDICKLASTFYPVDFTQQKIHALRAELEHYQLDIRNDCDKKVESYVMIQILIRLVLTLPVSTATAERAFSSMKFLKTARRNKMDDDLLSDCMIFYIERQLSEKIDLK